MGDRREFLKFAAAATLPVAVASASDPGQSGQGNSKELLGTWETIHSLGFPPGQFREFLSFSEGGVVQETNSFLHTASNLSLPGVPAPLNASDGFGNWERTGKGVFRVVFRKMLFDGSRTNIGDLHVTGTLRSDGKTLTAAWHITVVDTSGRVLADFGEATSTGTRLA